MPCLTLLLPVDVAERVDEKACGEAVVKVEELRRKAAAKVEELIKKADEKLGLSDESVSDGENDFVKQVVFKPKDQNLESKSGTDQHNGIGLLEQCVQKMVYAANAKQDQPADFELYKEKPKHLVFDWNQSFELEKRIKAISDSDSQAVLKRYAKEMRRDGGRKPVGMPTLESLDILQDQHPNFSEVISFVRNKLILAEKTGSFLRIPPILLSGDAGVGKTHFSKSLASALNTSIHRLAFDGPISSSALIGMDRQWGNTRAGLLFNAVVLGANANPVFVLDELDKARASRQDDPLAPLHTIFESGTAGEVKDLSTEVVFDASLVTWIATANYPLMIPPTIRSRLREFWIAMPGPADAIKITRYVAASVIENSAPLGFSLISDRLSVLLAHLTPREVVKAVGDAVACAVANGRMEVVKSDFSAEAIAEDVATDGAALLH